MSTLDARIRLLAREEAAHLLTITPEQAEEYKAREARFAAEQPTGRVAELESKLAALEARVEAMEKAPRRAATRRVTGE